MSATGECQRLVSIDPDALNRSLLDAQLVIGVEGPNFVRMNGGESMSFDAMVTKVYQAMQLLSGKISALELHHPKGTQLRDPAHLQRFAYQTFNHMTDRTMRVKLLQKALFQNLSDDLYESFERLSLQNSYWKHRMAEFLNGGFFCCCCFLSTRSTFGKMVSIIGDHAL